MRSPTILVADDDPEVLSYLETALLCHKYPVISAQDGTEALALLEEHKEWVSLVVMDMMMPCKDGVETLQELRRRHPDLPVVMLSGASDPDRIVEAMKAGAQEYLLKPIVHERLLDAVRRSLAGRPETTPAATVDVESAESDVSYIQVNPRMRAISAALRKTAAWNVPVVLRGESGVGKEVLARELHQLSPRAAKEFVKINCVALPSELLESELFGYERGAFTGAFKAKPGKFELADGGTILLDEIGDMDLKLQAKLLQVLQDGEFHRLGGKEPVRVDVRVLVATHRDLERAIEEGTFREDLYYRLNVVSIEVPPLRERKDEILPLAQHFLEKHCQLGVDPPDLTQELRHAFLTHDWPGNVRELENVVRRYLVFEDAHRLAVQLLAGRNNRVEARPASESRLAAAAAVGSRHAPPPSWPPAESLAEWDRIPDRGEVGQPPARLTDNLAVGATYTEAPSHGTTDGYHLGPGNGSTQPATQGWPPRLPMRDDFSEHRPEVDDTRNGNGVHNAHPHTERFDPAMNSRLERLETLLTRLVSSPIERPVHPPDGHVEANGKEGNGHTVTTLAELDEQRNQVESKAILAALEKTEWNRRKAAKMLKTDYKALLYRIKKLGIGERAEEG